MISHVGGGQREERLVRLVRRNGSYAPGADAGLGRLRLTALQVGTALGAPVAAVGAGAGVAGVGTVRAVRGSLAHFGVLLGVAAVAVVADGTALLVRGLAGGTVAVRRGLSGGRATAFVGGQLLLSVSGRAAAVGPGAGGPLVGRVGLLTRG